MTNIARNRVGVKPPSSSGKSNTPSIRFLLSADLSSVGARFDGIFPSVIGRARFNDRLWVCQGRFQLKLALMGIRPGWCNNANAKSADSAKSSPRGFFCA